MLTKVQIANAIHSGWIEQDLGALFAKDLSVFAEAYAHPSDEYIVFKEFPLDAKNQVDYVLFTDRSRMNVVFIEVKGADFNFLNRDDTVHADINHAILQVEQRIEYARLNYWKFRDDVLAARRDVEAGKVLYQSMKGKDLLIDPNKDVVYWGIAIGGRETDLIKDSKTRTRLEYGRSPHIKVESWDSFLRNLRRA